MSDVDVEAIAKAGLEFRHKIVPRMLYMVGALAAIEIAMGFTVGFSWAVLFSHITAMGFAFYVVGKSIEYRWGRVWQLFKGTHVYIPERWSDAAVWANENLSDDDWYVMYGSSVFVFKEPKYAVYMRVAFT